MKFSVAARVLTIGFTVAVMIIAAGSNSFAYAHKAKTKSTVVATHYAYEQPIKMRYYGGPKSPMYP